MPIIDDPAADQAIQERLLQVDQRLKGLERDRQTEDALRQSFPPAGPPKSAYLQELEAAQLAAAAERLQGAQEKAEQDRLQAELDAPLQAKRDADVARLKERWERAMSEAEIAQREADRLYAALLEFRNRPLR